MTEERIVQAVAGAWCSSENEHKVMDPDLANKIVQNILEAQNEITTGNNR